MCKSLVRRIERYRDFTMVDVISKSFGLAGGTVVALNTFEVFARKSLATACRFLHLKNSIILRSQLKTRSANRKYCIQLKKNYLSIGYSKITLLCDIGRANFACKCKHTIIKMPPH